MILLRQLTLWLALAGLAFAAVAVIRANTTVPPPAPPVAPPARPFARAVGAAGLVEARHENTAVGTPAPGLVTEVAAAPWDPVREGQVLLRLDDSELRARLITQRATIALREAEVARARSQALRARTLSTSGAGHAAEAEDAALALGVAEAALRSAHAEIEQTETLLARLVIRAPRDGTVLQVNVRKGEYLVPGATPPPFVVGSASELQVRAEVDEQLAPRVREGARAVGFLKGDASRPIALSFLRIEPFVVPKRSLTGASTERVDTRVLQVVFGFSQPADRRIYVGQQLDLFIEEP
jgi:RND family efflux transporter MFP subunit